MRTFGLRSVVAAVALFAVVGTASAAVTFDPETGTGFVGKGDVQLAFGWNNSQLQRNASGVTFTYVATETWAVPCIKETKKEIIENTFNRTSSISATVAYDPRVKNQITGFNLTGISGSSTDGNLACPGGFDSDPDETPTLVSSEGGLHANYGGTSVLLN